MLSYQKLVNYLKKQHHYPVSFKSEYFVINVPGYGYHITVFQDQWDNYEDVSERPYYLFHISSESNQNRCSSYFWVKKYDNRIKKIPRKYFMYNQPNYSFFSSTRSPCPLAEIMPLLRIFQKILKDAN